ncbi:hypothetical protein HAX54_010533 [Datura stramonium]|uniref:Disease resistance protein winged helix domain-containing protein n=1 Tax=Datura stramonium TaxID=4076 RepID=A0ABS8TGG0_DATST|nr:hypothetical protein [Datura stramonium]
MNVAQYASFPDAPFPMLFLEPEESWNLFCQKAFGKQDCPTEFESVAKVVVETCKALPLMISVVAGTLSSKRTLDVTSVSTFVNLDDYQRCSGLLALSYNHLPSHLKSCFLYFVVFPKASEISVKKLIRLWVAQGLLDIKGLEGLEKAAIKLFYDLIDKSLIVVRKRNLDGKIKTCRINDLLHDLCLREAESKRMLYVSVGLGGHEVPFFPKWYIAPRLSKDNSPPKVSTNEGIRSLVNLQSVSGLDPSCCTEEVLEGLKKVKKIRDLWPYSFPPNLKKLTLQETYLECEDMTISSKLPKLEVLQLKDSAFGGKWTSKGSVWEVEEVPLS